MCRIITGLTFAVLTAGMQNFHLLHNRRFATLSFHVDQGFVGFEKAKEKSWQCMYMQKLLHNNPYSLLLFFLWIDNQKLTIADSEDNYNIENPKTDQIEFFTFNLSIDLAD
jgi:hypothetical protein